MPRSRLLNLMRNKGDVTCYTYSKNSYNNVSEREREEGGYSAVSQQLHERVCVFV